MTILTPRRDSFTRSDPYFLPAETVEAWLAAVKTPVHEWNTPLRHLYVLTWPCSSIVRGVAIVLLVAAILALGMGGYFAARLAYIWHGERSPWG